MRKTIKVKKYSELAKVIESAINDGYKFRDTINGDGTIIFDKQDDEIAIVIIDGVLMYDAFNMPPKTISDYVNHGINHI